MNRFQAHATDEWQTDTLVIQVRRVTDTGYTSAVGQVLEGLDEMPTMVWEPLTDDQHDGTTRMVPTPGIRLHREAAIAMAQEVIRATGAPSDPSEAQRLKDENDALAADLRERDAELASAEAQATQWEVLVLAKDELIETMRAHLEREAETVNSERFRQIGGHEDAAAALLEREVFPPSTIQAPHLPENVQESLNRAFRNMSSVFKPQGD